MDQVECNNSLRQNQFMHFHLGTGPFGNVIDVII